MASLHIYLDTEKIAKIKGVETRKGEYSENELWKEYSLPGIDLSQDLQSGKYHISRYGDDPLLDEVPSIISEAIDYFSFREHHIVPNPSLEEGFYHHKSARAEVKEDRSRNDGYLDCSYSICIRSKEISDMREIYFAIRNRSLKPAISYNEKHEEEFEKKDKILSEITKVSKKIFAT